MTVARKIHDNSIVAGAGEVRLAVRLAGGDYDGERYVGDSAALSLAVTRNVIDVQSGDGATPRTIKEIVTSTERTFSLVLNDTNIENLALFFQADIDEQPHGNAAITDEELKVYPGRWHQLGQSAANPLGVGAIDIYDGNGEVLSDLDSKLLLYATKSDAIGGTTTSKYEITLKPEDVFGASAKATKDILLDARRGAIYISPHGTTLNTDGPHTIYADYTPNEPDGNASKNPGREDSRPARKRFKSTTKAQEGAIRYTEQGTDGEPGQDIYARLCSVTASGEAAFKGRDSQRQIGLSLKVLRPDDGYPAIAGIESMGSESYDG